MEGDRGGSRREERGLRRERDDEREGEKRNRERRETEEEEQEIGMIERG